MERRRLVSRHPVPRGVAAAGTRVEAVLYRLRAEERCEGVGSHGAVGRGDGTILRPERRRSDGPFHSTDNLGGATCRAHSDHGSAVVNIHSFIEFGLGLGLGLG